MKFPSSLALSLALVAIFAALSACRPGAAPSSAAAGDPYPPPDQASRALSAALAQAAQSGRRVLLVFGANWCPDCRALERYLHDTQNRPLLERSFVLVPVNVGRFDANLALASRYGVPLEKGIPAVAVLDARGELLTSQKSGEFGNMRRMGSESVTRFLQRYAQN